MATNAAMVRGMLGPMYSTRISLDSPVRTAGILLRRMLACAVRKGIDVDADTQQEIETALAAHVYQLMDPAYTQRSTLSASGSFEGQTGMRLEGTKFGQLAMTLDPSGCLEEMNKPAHKAGILWLGKPKRDETDYDSRNN